MLKVAGRTLLDHSIDHLANIGIEKVVINIHHLGSLIEQHITRRADVEVVISDESDELLETGGGIMKALPLLGEDPFFVINGDVLWLDGPTPALQRLAGTWDNKHMDALLLLHSTVEAYGYDERRFYGRPRGRPGPTAGTGGLPLSICRCTNSSGKGSCRGPCRALFQST